MILANSLYTINLLNITSFNFQPANVLNWWHMVHIHFCISSLWLFLLKRFFTNCNSAIPFSAQILKSDLHVVTSVPITRLLFLSGPPSPPFPCTCQWPCLSCPSQNSLSPWSCPDLWSELLSLSPHTPITTLQFRSPCTCYAHCCPWLRPIHPWCASSISSLPQIRAHYTCIFILLNSFPLFH